MTHRIFLFFSCLLFVIATRAEKIKSTAEIFETPYASQAVAWLDRGAEVWVDGTSSNSSRIKVYVKVWVKRKDMTRSTAKPNAVLHDRNGNVVGGTYLAQATVYDTTSSFSTHCLIFRGYIFKDRIDPKSIPELELAKLLDPIKSKADTSVMNPFLKYFNFEEKMDTAGFTFYQMEGKDGPRMSLVFQSDQLVAVVPTHSMKLKYFEAELHQSDLHVIYLRKLSPQEEELFTEVFSPR
ncbi:MAG: hypothetical protein GC180_06675 [Bacteroidetes bacterium]|nr:hypothetical protein [Bacteroidota bacterium]